MSRVQHGRCPAGWRGERGFTLLELTLVTMIIGILSMLGSSLIHGMRERAFKAATVTELRHATSAMERYHLVHNRWPAALADLANVGYEPSTDIDYCRFQRVGAGGALEYVAMEAAHRLSETVVTSHYPLWNNEVQESTRPGGCGGAGAAASASPEAASPEPAAGGAATSPTPAASTPSATSAPAAAAPPGNSGNAGAGGNGNAGGSGNGNGGGNGGGRGRS